MAASISAKDSELPSDSIFVGQFALDVILFNLKVCGHERQHAALGHTKIAYSRPNFVRIAAVSVLRLCLTYRDKWKQNIKELAKNVSVYDSTFFSKCMSHIVDKALKEGKEALQLNVEITLALATEMALYLISENRKFDLIGLVCSVSLNILYLIETPLERAFHIKTGSPTANFKQELENLFNECENIWEILGWMEEFIRNYAIPYGSREDLSAIFYQEVGKRWKSIVERVYQKEKPSVEAVKINLGFLPRVAYDAIKAETSVPMPKYSEVAWGRHPEKPSGSSEAGKESGKRHQFTVSGTFSKQTFRAGSSGKDSSEQAAQGGQTSKDSLDHRLDEVLTEMDLGSERSSQASRGATSKRYRSGK